jgi:fumarate reductase subunit C
MPLIFDIIVREMTGGWCADMDFFQWMLLRELGVPEGVRLALLFGIPAALLLAAITLIVVKTRRRK